MGFKSLWSIILSCFSFDVRFSYYCGNMKANLRQIMVAFYQTSSIQLTTLRSRLICLAKTSLYTQSQELLVHQRYRDTNYDYLFRASLFEANTVELGGGENC